MFVLYLLSLYSSKRISLTITRKSAASTTQPHLHIPPSSQHPQLLLKYLSHRYHRHIQRPAKSSNKDSEWGDEASLKAKFKDDTQFTTGDPFTAIFVTEMSMEDIQNAVRDMSGVGDVTCTTWFGDEVEVA
jgi:hypothetical protein